jgi:hypothetical protein
MRPFKEDGTWDDKQRKVYILDAQGEKIYDKKTRQYKCGKVQITDWNEQTKAEEWRGAWADLANKYLEHLKHPARIDHRSYERQGIEQIPTIHLGVAASQMEKRKIPTERGNINRQIEVTNRNLRQLKARIVELEKWIKEEAANTEPPTLAEILQGIFERKAKEGYSQHAQTMFNLKDGANMFNFIQRHDIRDMAGLEKKIISMHTEQSAIRDELKPIERRLTDLDKHIKQAGIIKQYSGIYRQYKQQKPKDQEAFFEKNRAPLTLYEAAERHIKGVLNGRAEIPLKSWEKEQEQKTADKNKLNKRFNFLRDEVKEVEKIHRNVYDILREEQREQQPRRAQEIDR